MSEKLRRLIAVAALCSAGCAVDPAERAKVAKAHAERLGLHATGASCSDRDSDWDGYVSCSVAYTVAGSEASGVKLLDLECSDGGCKSVRPVAVAP